MGEKRKRETERDVQKRDGEIWKEGDIKVALKDIDRENKKVATIEREREREER